MTSLPQIGGYSPLPVNELLDAWVILFIVFCFTMRRTPTTFLVFALVLYLFGRFTPAVATSSPMPDFLQAYRWLLYLIAFALAVGKTWGPMRPLIRVTWTLIALSLIKTLITLAALGPSKRSGLLTENNFELALYCGATALFYTTLSSRQRLWTMAVLGSLVAMSGSRSGAVAFSILIVYAVIQAKSASLLGRYLIGFSIPAAALAVAQTFETRAEAGGVDRLNFFGVFMNETSNWGLTEWLFGTAPITPLSTAGCSAMSYYKDLFASTGNGACYSVVLHAFVMRVVFDAGLIGLVLAVSVTWWTLRRGGVSLALTLALTGVAVTNGLSVSGLNSPYVALPILVAICAASTRSEETPLPHGKDRSIDRSAVMIAHSLLGDAAWPR